jgi:hypothetical protein
MAAAYRDSVFLNIPFDAQYAPLFDAMVFCVHDCGFIARSVFEIDDSGEARVAKILKIMQQSQFGIHDIAHNDQPRDAIRAVRDWLSTHRPNVQIPGGRTVFERYERFRAQLEVQAGDVRLDVDELTFGDYTKLVVGWLTKNP